MSVGGESQSLALTRASREIKDWDKSQASGEAAVGANAAAGAAVGANAAVGDGGSTLYWLAADLFPKHTERQGDESFRGGVEPSREFADCIRCTLKMNDSKDVLLIADGRSETVRKSIRDVLTSDGAPLNELWIVYDMETKLHTDIRNPKRKNAFSCANFEIVFAVLAECIRGQRTLTVRENFTKSGESTSFCKSYTGVPFRNLVEIPRVTADTKRHLLGPSAVGDFTKDRVKKEIAERGQPLFWAEWKPVGLMVHLFRDFHPSLVVDLTPGSGAAFCAAIHAKVRYAAICHNEASSKWLKDWITRAFLALVANTTVASDAKVVASIERYLARSVMAAKKELPSMREESAFGDSIVGDDDSDEDE